MDSEAVCAVGFLGFSGIFSIVLGTLIWTGHFKGWFAVQRVPVILPTAFYNGSMVFAGLIPISLAVAVLLGRPGLSLLWGLTFPLLVITVILAIWQPRWILPAWYRWLEDNHEEIIPILQEEVRQSGFLGPLKWQRRVSTQEGLEEWVEEVRRKRGL